MDQTLKDILNLLLNPTVTFFVGILTVLMARNNTVFSIARERLIYAYQPLFMEIEPFLYKKTTYNDIVPFLQKYREIEKQYALYVSPTLRNAINGINEFSFDEIPEYEDYKYDEWFKLCHILSHDYDSLCRQCHIPVRSIAYRVTNKQYRNCFLLMLGMFWMELPFIVGLASIICMFAFPQFAFIPYIAIGVILLRKIFERL